MIEDQQEHLLFGAFFDHHKDSSPFPFETSWGEFCKLLEDIHVREDKFACSGEGAAPGYSLAKFVAKEGAIARKNIYVNMLSGIVLDFDTEFDIDDVLSRLEGVAYAAHTTWKHGTENYGPRWRVIVPFATPILGPQYKTLRAWLMRRLAGTATRENKEDKQASALSNFYYLPCCAPGNEELYELRIGEGTFLEAPALSEFTRGVPETRILGNKVDWAWLKAKMSAYPKDAEMRKAFRAVIKGVSFSAHGSRDSLLTRMCGALAGWAPNAPAEELAAIFAPSLAVMEAEHPEDPPPSMELTVDKVQRAQDGLNSQAREENSMRAESAQEIPLKDKLESEALDEQAQRVGLANGEELLKRLILRENNSTWVWDPILSDWRGPHGDASTMMIARQQFTTLPGVDPYMRKADGNIRLKTLQEFQDDHAELIREVVYDLCATVSHFDVETSKLTLVGAARRPLEAKYSEFVDTWFRALGADREESFLDWMAGLTWLHRGNSVLFLTGTPDVGKGLLMRGLARVWKTDSPVDVKKMTDNHGAFELHKCPLLKIDEGKWNKYVDATSLIRELVTQSARMINRKHHDPYELVGYLRVIIAANNFNIFSNDEHSLTPDDRDAIAQRFLQINPSEEARELLLSISAEERANLAEEDHIARHVLWLSENREVKSEGRFIVPGEKDSGFATRIITEDHRWGSWVVEWLARYLTDPQKVEASERGLVFRGGGKVIISPEAVVNTFEKVLKNKQRPQSLDISNALKSLSRPGHLVAMPGGKGGVGFDIMIESIAKWAQEKGVGNPTRIRANTIGIVKGEDQDAGTLREESVGAGANNGAPKVRGK